MKNIHLLALALLMPLALHSQVCVTLYQGDDFGLNDVESRVSALEIDDSNHVWFALKTAWGGNGVGKYDGMNWRKVNSSFLPDPRCSSIAFDKEDSVWIATQQGLGIIHISTLQGRTLKTANGLPEANVTAIAVDSNNVKWIGFASGKVASFDGSVFTVHKTWSNSPVKVIEVASDSSIWVGLGDSPGVVRYKNGKWTPNSTVKSVPAITADKWGRVMVASGDSMIIYNGNTENVVHATAGNTLRDIVVGEAGKVWASSSQGLLIRDGSRFVLYSKNNSAVPAQLSEPIEFDSEDNLWFGYTYLISSSGYCGAGYLSRAPLQQTAVITSDKPDFAFCYGDSLTLTAEADKVSYIWPDGSNTDTYSLFDADTVEVAVEGDNHCFYYDTIRTIAQKVYEKEKVCAVSVDSNGKNIIIWEKTLDVETASYNIYRELITDSFELLANVPINKLSVFEDKEVDPTQRSAKYKISSVDTCGNESGQSFYHRTLHLQISKGIKDGDINLDWSAYEGMNFPHYIINRGYSPNSLTELTTVPSSVLKYTDMGVFDTVYYRISIPITNACKPDGTIKAGTGPYHHSLSNMDDNKFKTSFTGNLKADREIHAYPNPFTEMTRIEFSNPAKSEYQLRVYNLSGKLVLEKKGIINGEVFIRRENLYPGYYVFELRGENFFRGKFLIR